MSWYGGWKPYVPVAKRRANASRYAARLAKKEKRTLAPVTIDGRKIATSFWGQAWCDHLEHHCDFENRLPRGRTYVRNGSVIDLQVQRGQVRALVSGSDVYTVTIKIKTLAPAGWKRIKEECSQSISSLIDLLQGRFDEGIMRRLSDPQGGLFPRPAEIDMKCSCPDWATMCKHVAAVLYGVGARLDVAPELLFTLRNVDHLELVNQAVAADSLDQALHTSAESALAGNDLEELFGIEIDAAKPAAKTKKRRPSSLPATAKAEKKVASKVIAKARRSGRKPVSATAKQRPLPK